MVVDATTDPDWAAFVGQTESNLFQSDTWSRVLSATYGFAMKVAVLRQDSSIVAAVPFVLLDDIRGVRLTCLPFSDFCGPLSADERSWEALVDEMATFGAPITIRSLRRDFPAGDSRFAIAGRAHWDAVDLTPGEENLFAGFTSSARRAIRRASKVGVTVRQATDKEELRRFFQLHLRVRKNKYRLLAQPFRFFESIWDEFIAKDQGALLLAELEGELVAGTVFLDWGDSTYYKFNASDENHPSARANEAVMWAGMLRGIARGCVRLDLGLSDWEQDGLVRYKRKFSSEHDQITSWSWDPAGREPASTGGRLLDHMTRLFTDPGVPDSLTEKAGELLYQYFA